MNKSIKVRIGLYPFIVSFVDFEELKEHGHDAETLHNERIIKIRNDLDRIMTEIILRHEIVHALLGTQGRAYQKKFDLEEMCEFIAYKTPEINDIVETVMEIRGDEYEYRNL